MKDRIFEVMRMVGKTSTDFASTIDISPAVLSSIKSGRTKPTLFLVEKIKSVYPNININWLITGEGEMFTDGVTLDIDTETKNTSANKENPIREEDKQSSTVVNPPVQHEEDKPAVSAITPVKQHEEEKPAVTATNKESTDIKPCGRRISQIIVLYNDGTFETLVKD